MQKYTWIAKEIGGDVERTLMAAEFVTGPNTDGLKVVLRNIRSLEDSDLPSIVELMSKEKPIPVPAACKPCVGEDGWTLKKTCTHHPTKCGGFHCNVCRCYEAKTCKTCGNGSPDGYVCHKSVGRECADTGTRQHWIPRAQPAPDAKPSRVLHEYQTTGGATDPAVVVPQPAAKPDADPDDCRVGCLDMSVEQAKKRYRKPADVRPSYVDDQLVERVAEAIYRHQGGITDDECISVYGKPRRAWKTDAPWDSNPMELSEHERDEYRMQARAALAVMRAEMIPAPDASVAAQRVLDSAVKFEQFETKYEGLIEVASTEQVLVPIAQKLLRELLGSVRSFNAEKVKP